VADVHKPGDFLEAALGQPIQPWQKDLLAALDAAKERGDIPPGSRVQWNGDGMTSTMAGDGVQGRITGQEPVLVIVDDPLAPVGLEALDHLTVAQRLTEAHPLDQIRHAQAEAWKSPSAKAALKRAGLIGYEITPPDESPGFMNRRQRRAAAQEKRR
jgi:hypothetical protein